MIDIKIIKDEPQRIEAELKKRGIKLDVKKLVRLDGLRREYQQQYEKIRTAQKKVKSADEGKKFKTKLKKVETDLKKIQVEFDGLCLQLPNFSLEDVPVGEDESGNKPIRQIGEQKRIDGAKEHFDIPAIGPLLDLERAAKVAGARFNYLKGPLALLQFALINFTLETVTDEETLKKIAADAKLDVPATPFVPIVPPAMLRTDMLQRMGRLDPPEDKYHLPEDDLTLSGSAEHTIGSMYADEVLDEKDLPLRYIGYSTAFRREAGSYGKDTKGILRRHQFDKLEMESFTTPSQSIAEQDFLVAIQEHLVSSLGLPYQVVAICTGDMGAPDARQIDIEVWMPGEGKYRETHTADLVTDFQARRLNTKFRSRNGKTELVHMNDATACAIGRMIIAITENQQDKDGNVEIPEVLRKYLSFSRIKADGTTE